MVIVPGPGRARHLRGPHPEAARHGDGPGARLHRLRRSCSWAGCRMAPDHEGPGRLRRPGPRGRAWPTPTGGTGSCRSSTPAPTSRARATRCGSRSSGWARATSSASASAAAARSGGCCPTPTPTSSSRWSARSSGLVGAVVAARPVLRAGLVRVAGRHPGPRPVRQPAGRGHHHLDHQPGGDQHRRGDRRAAGHRHPAAVHLLRRLVARHHHGRRRHPRQHRLARAGRRPADRAAPAATAPTAVSGRRYALVAGGGTAGHLQPALAIAEALVDAGHDRDTIEFVGSRAGPGPGHPRRAGLPGHPAARAGASSAASAPRDLVGNVGAVGRAGRGRACWAFGAGGPGPAPGGGLGGRLRQRAGRPGRRGAAGPPGAGQRRRRARGGQPAVRPVRPGQRGRVGRARRCPVRWSPARRCARRSPRSGGAPTAGARGPPALGLPAGPAHGGRRRRLARRRAGSTRRWSALADRWADRGRPVDLPRRRPAGLGRRRRRRGAGRTSRRPGPGPRSSSGSPTRSGWTLVYAAADVVVCRAGAMTVAELAVAGVPSVLVPLPGAPGDHQTANARVLERAGGAVVLRRRRVRPAPRWPRSSTGCSPTRPRSTAMGGPPRALGRPDAAAAGRRAWSRPAPGPGSTAGRRA